MINKTVIIYDYGLYLPLAKRLAREFSRVLYFSPWKSSFPMLKDFKIGSGYPEFERSEHFWDDVNDADIIIFPDIYTADIQNHLKRLNVQIWGSGYAEDFETDRIMFREYLKKSGHNLAEAEYVTGMDALKEKLMNTEDVYIKLSKFRGDWETFHHESWSKTEPIFEEKFYLFGLDADEMEFIIEKPIDGIEIGVDGFTINGLFPNKMQVGIEIKNLGWIGRIKPFAEMPKQIIKTTNALVPIFSNYESTGFFSTEIRVDKSGKEYLTDPTMRMPFPPGNVEMENIVNLGEIIDKGSQGIMVEPIFEAEYIVEAIIDSPWAEYHRTQVTYDKKYERQIKIKNSFMKDGKEYTIPVAGQTSIGAVVGWGNSMEAAVEHMKEAAKSVWCVDVNVRTDFMDKATKVIDEMKKIGITF